MWKTSRVLPWSLGLQLVALASSAASYVLRLLRQLKKKVSGFLPLALSASWSRLSGLAVTKSFASKLRQEPVRIVGLLRHGFSVRRAP